jgi:hypothetical protein
MNEDPDLHTMNADPRLWKKSCGDLWPIRLAAGESGLVQSLAQLEGNHHIVPKHKLLY